MAAAHAENALMRQAGTLRRFNRLYTTRLGLLRRDYLGTGFSLTEARILYEVARGAEVTAASLGRALFLDAGYISRLVTTLEKRGLVRKKPSPRDRRASFLELTRAGRRGAEQLDRQATLDMERLLETVPARERGALVESLARAHRILAQPDSVVVRATPAQAEEARTLLSEYYEEIGVVHRDTPESLQSFLNTPQAGLWIAYAEGCAAGCVVLRPLKGIAESIAAAGECKRLYVRARFRRRGIAEALLDAMEEFARGLALQWIYLDSKDDLEAALALYRRRGYEPCERYNENTQATIFLRKSLRADRHEAVA